MDATAAVAARAVFLYAAVSANGMSDVIFFFWKKERNMRISKEKQTKKLGVVFFGVLVDSCVLWVVFFWWSFSGLNWCFSVALGGGIWCTTTTLFRMFVMDNEQTTRQCILALALAAFFILLGGGVYGVYTDWDGRIGSGFYASTLGVFGGGLLVLLFLIFFILKNFCVRFLHSFRVVFFCWASWTGRMGGFLFSLGGVFGNRLDNSLVGWLGGWCFFVFALRHTYSLVF